MKIVVVTPYFPLREQPYRGHSAYQTLLRLKHWADVEVLCPLTTYPSWFLPRNFPYSRTDLTYSPPGLRATYFEYPALPGITRPLNGTICASYLERRLEKLKADVILNYWIYPEGYAAVAAGRKLGIPVILGAIGSDLNRIPDSITRWNTQRALRRATFTITVSRHLREQAIRLGAPAAKVRAILNGCDTSVFYPANREAARGEAGIEPDARLLLYIGRLDLAKGLRELIEALAVSRDSKTRLALVGEGPARPTLEACANKLGVSGQVIFAGVCGSAGVARWMAAANVFCLPSYAEGCPNVLVEALSCGRPVVATKVGGIPELIEDRCGVLIPPRDSQALAVALQNVLAREWDQEAIAGQYRRSWEQVAEETFEVCKTVCPVERQEVGIDSPHLLLS